MAGGGAQELLEDVDLMGPKVDDGAAAQHFMPAPVAELMHRLETINFLEKSEEVMDRDSIHWAGGSRRYSILRKAPTVR
jgi:hypothetical protein